MARIAFLLLAHKDPEWVIAQAEALTAHGDFIAVHYDGRASDADFGRIKAALADNPNAALARRVKCGWGEYSLVNATLNLIKVAMRQFRDATHFFLISGDCFPTKSRSYFDEYLDDERDVIESHDFFESEWIRTGLKEDRLIYRHWFNERKWKWFFYAS
ncbi:MAG: beta-1,6-N-acetylglucosaminyltransferase, partial [Pseudomonadota bacterium]